MRNTRYSIADNSPEAAAERNVPRNPRPLCREFVAQAAPAEFWCATCHWNRPMHDDEAHRSAIADELARLEDGEWAARPSTCLACPGGCSSCTRDESDCECYEHQDRHPDNQTKGA